MKRPIIIIFGLMLPSILFVSCTKESSDVRDKFAGSWTGNLYFARIGNEYTVTILITRDPDNSSEIIVELQGSGELPRKATVSGNTYHYTTFKSNLGISGNYSGQGILDAGILTESGMITSDGALFQGDLGEWGTHLTRQ